MCLLSVEFYENQLNSFCAILLTNKLTNADENITSLAESRWKQRLSCLSRLPAKQKPKVIVDNYEAYYCT